MILHHDLPPYALAAAIGLWAHLWVNVISEPDQIFHPVRRFFRWALKMPDPNSPHSPKAWQNALYLPIIGCQNCHAGQVALWYQAWKCWNGEGFDVPFIVVAIGSALYFYLVAKALAKWGR